MNPRVMRPDDFARLNSLAVERDCQRFANLEARLADDGDLKFERRRSSDLDVDLCAYFTVRGARRYPVPAVLVVPP
jgi:hypothetical protein